MSISTKNIDISYSRNGRSLSVLNQFNIEIQEGTMVAIIGSNGSGKSSLLRVLAGLQKPTNGLVSWHQKSLETISTSNRPRQAACLFSDYSRVEGMSVYEVVSLGRLPYTNWLGKLEDNDHEIIQSSIARLGIESFTNTAVTSLSDGEFRKVLLAKILAQETKYLFLDEPTTHLDMKSSHDIIIFLHELAKTESKIVMFSSHNLQLALKYADSVIALDTSGNHASGEPEEVFKLPIMNSLLDRTKVDFQEGNFNFI